MGSVTDTYSGIGEQGLSVFEIGGHPLDVSLCVLKIEKYMIKIFQVFTPPNGENLQRGGRELCNSITFNSLCPLYFV